MQPWRLSMAGGMEHSGEHGSGATVHGSMNREHREMEGVLANTSRLRRRPEGKAEAAVAMAGGQELPGRTRNSQTSHQMPKEKVGEREGSKEILTMGKTRSEMARGRGLAHGGSRRSLVLLRATVAASDA